MVSNAHLLGLYCSNAYTQHYAVQAAKSNSRVLHHHKLELQLLPHRHIHRGRPDIALGPLHLSRAVHLPLAQSWVAAHHPHLLPKGRLHPATAASADSVLTQRCVGMGSCLRVSACWPCTYAAGWQGEQSGLMWWNAGSCRVSMPHLVAEFEDDRGSLHLGGVPPRGNARHPECWAGSDCGGAG